MGQSTVVDTRLPALIGREAALAETCRLLVSTPLLTLTGPGGCGKTRLALEIAREMAPQYPDGVWEIELAAVQDTTLLAEVVCAALGVRQDVCPADELLAFLRDRAALLVFDNCEHLLPGCVALVETLLRACPRVRILATSREILNSAFEVVWPVPPLSFPEEALRIDAERASAYAAVQLFVQRAAAAVPTFALSDGNVAAIGRICRHLDGLPLAVELAASCMKALAPEQIATQLERGSPILTEGYRTAAVRHQTLEAAIQWSYCLLTPAEQALFRRVSLLAGTFELEAAAALDGNSAEIVLGHLRRLIDKSLVTVVAREGQARYRVLETLRQYGRQQLCCAGEQQDTYLRYSAWVTQLVAGTSMSHSTDDCCEQALWLETCERELDHLRAVLGWLVEHDQAACALHLATALTPFWRQRGRIGEGRRWLELALGADCGAAEVSTLARAYALNALGVLLMWQGAYAQAQTCHEDALALFDAADDWPGVARTLFRLGFLADRRGDYPAATAHLERSLQVSQQLADGLGVDLARNRLGVVAWNQGKYARAVAALEQSLDFQRARADPEPGAYASTLLNLGMLALERGDAERATALLQESLSLNQALHDFLALTYAHTYLGLAALCRRDSGASAQAFGDALALLDPDGGAEIVCRLLDGIAMLAIRQAKTADAVRIWGRMDRFRAQHMLTFRPTEQQRFEQGIAAARHDLGDEAFVLAWRQGCAMALAEVLTEASGIVDALADGHTSGEADAKIPNAIVARVRTGHRSGGEMLDSRESQSALLRFYALGQVEAYRGDLALTTTDLTYSKARELLFFLLTHAPSTREQIGLALWPDATPDYLQRTFRVVVYHLRRALGHEAWVMRDRHYYTFNRSLAYRYDVEAFEAAAREANKQHTAAPDRAVTSLEAAQALYRGDFWQGVTASEWIVREQARLQRRYLDVLLTLGELYRTQGAIPSALETFLQAIERDRYCEEAHRGAMRCYLQLHEPGKAGQHLDRLRQDFKEQLGLSPAAETLALLG